MDFKISRLLLAAEQGNLFIVTELLDKGYHVNSTDEEGVNALHSAAANGNENVVRLLLSRGARLEATTNYGWTALMLASYYGHFMVCWILLQHKADLHVQSELGSTALDCAARNGHVQIVVLLIEADGQQVRGDNSPTKLCLDAALMNAAQHGHEAALKLLLEKGADVNCKEETTGWTALMLAALNGHMTAAQILIEFGADTNVLNVIDQTALEIAVVRQKTEVQGFLDERTSTRPQIKGQKFVCPSIIEAARNGNYALVEELLEQGEVDKNATDEDGATPLMYAAIGGHLSVVQLLIARGADINKQDRASGWTALMQATYHGYKEVAKLLIESGADVTIQGNTGCRAFDIGSITGNTDIVRLLASVSMQFPLTPKSYYNNSSSLQTGKGKVDSKSVIVGSEKDISKIDSDFAEHHGEKKWWSKLSSRFRNLNVNRTFKIQSSKIQVMHSSKSMDNLYLKGNSKSPFTDTSPVTTDSAVTWISLASVITDSALKRSGGIRPQSLALVSHVDKLPDDVITPVVPPPLPSSSFELPRMQRRQRSDNLGNQSAPQHPSSISAYPAYRQLTSPTFKKTGNFTGSPESSYSTASFYSSASNNSGSKTLKASMGDQAFNPMSAMSPSLWHKTGRGATSQSPTLMPIQSAAMEGSSLHKDPSYSSLQGHADDTSHSSHSRNRYTFKNELDYSEDDLENILKNLSLQKYQPIFEEQEVDMEAFLTLNDRDLSELGVTCKDARQQILTAINELNSGKDRERQHVHEAFSSYHSNKSAGTSGYVSPSTSTNFPQWSLKQPP